METSKKQGFLWHRKSEGFSSERTIKQLSKTLEVSEEKLVRDGVSYFIQKELKDASAEILRLKNKYKVISIEELKDKIEKGKIEEHPAWEDLIFWENLQKRIRMVKNWMRKLPIIA